jgi:hypothetical protein
VNFSSNDGTNQGSFQLPKSTIKIDSYQEAPEGDTLQLSGTNFVAPTVL